MSNLQAKSNASNRDDHVWATPLARTMVPDAYGAIWCDAATGSYWADSQASKILNIEPGGSLEDDLVGELLRETTPHPGGPQRYYTFRNHCGHVARARLLASPSRETIILVDDLDHITTRVFELKSSEREYRELFEHTPYGIHRSTLDGRLLHANPALVRLNGYDSESEMMDRMKDVTHQCYVEPDRGQAFLAELKDKGKIMDFVSEVYRHKTGERIWISEAAWLVHDEAGYPRYMAGTIMDITERMKYLERVTVAAKTDALTGIANRAAFVAELDHRISAAREHGVTLLFIDCDRFKDINDIYGHARGDAVLKMCADRLRQVIPPDAMLARLGGDEFAVLTTSITSRTEALAMARRIGEAIRAPIEVNGAAHMLDVSIGISRFPDHAQTARDLMRNADLALYAVKDGNRGEARLFDEELDRVQQLRHALERDLRGAHHRQEFELYYQPVVDAQTLSIVSLEALIRWRHPARGLVRPGDFIAVAEDAGLMLAFGQWAIHEACRHAAALPSTIKVAVNVSALQFRSSDLPTIVSGALAANGLDASRLELEVTESMVLKNEAATFQVLDQLRSLGVKVALDDFGTGYSTLSSLQRFCFDKVKIDRSFIQSINTNPVNRAVTRAVLSIGRELHLDVVAEGIETEADRQSLLDEGCILQQGYFYGQPQPFAEIATAIALGALRPAGGRTVAGGKAPAAGRRA